MQDNLLASLARLSDAELIGQVKTLVTREREAMAELIAHLAELDTRDVHLRAGYPSLYIYCRDVLGLSEWEAYNRIEVARAARRFPVILDLLADGSVSLTAVRLLAPHFTSDNHRDVLEAARGKKKAEIDEIVARLSPRPDAASSIRRLPTERSPQGPEPQGGDAVPVSDPGRALLPSSNPVSEPRASLSFVPPSAAAHSSPIPSTTVMPLSPDRYQFQVTIGGDTLEKIRLAKDMLGHAIPSGDDAAILDRAFTALLAELAKKRFADTPRPKDSRRNNPDRRSASTTVGKPAARTPSAAVKRAVWLRDLGRCAFVGTGGHRCNGRRFVEFHHVDPYALGGEATVDGIQLRCRRHNDYEGRLYFGKGRHARDRELVPEQVPLSATRSTSERPGWQRSQAQSRPPCDAETS